jgi:hypothetical protein
LILRSGRRDETIFSRSDTISPALRSRPETDQSYKHSRLNGGFGHVGIHHQFDLRSGLQALFGRDGDAPAPVDLTGPTSPLKTMMFSNAASGMAAFFIVASIGADDRGCQFPKPRKRCD